MKDTIKYILFLIVTTLILSLLLHIFTSWTVFYIGLGVIWGIFAKPVYDMFMDKDDRNKNSFEDSFKF